MLLCAWFAQIVPHWIGYTPFGATPAFVGAIYKGREGCQTYFRGKVVQSRAALPHQQSRRLSDLAWPSRGAHAMPLRCAIIGGVASTPPPSLRKSCPLGLPNTLVTCMSIYSRAQTLVRIFKYDPAYIQTLLQLVSSTPLEISSLVAVKHLRKAASCWTCVGGTLLIGWLAGLLGISFAVAAKH